MADQTLTGTNFVEANLSSIIKGADFGAINFNIPTFDFTSANIDVYFRKSNAKGRPISQISEVAGVTIVDATNFSIDQFTMTWAAGTYYYDIKIVLSTGVIYKPFYGTFKVKEDADD